MTDVSLSFSDIETLLGCQLPISSRMYPAWWSNEEVGRHTQAKAWTSRGWITTNLRLNEERVAFRLLVPGKPILRRG